MTRCKDCGRLYENIPTHSHLPCPVCAFYARAHAGQIYGQLTATMTLQQAHNATLVIAHAKNKHYICELDRQMIDEVLDALHEAIMTAFPQAVANRYMRELVGEFDIEIEVEEIEDL